MKKLMLVFGVALAFCTTAMASDIAFYIGPYNPGWYSDAQFAHVDTIIAETGGLFRDVQKFDDKQLVEFGAWVDKNTNDGEMDIIWLNGTMPSVLYQFPNVNPDGSRAELWLDGGNMIINVGDWFAYVSYEGGVRSATNGANGAANILDLASGVIASADTTRLIVTPTGQKYLPSLPAGVETDRPVVLAQVRAPWEVAAAFASTGGTDSPTEVRADPVVIHNTVTNGYLAIINQDSGSGWLADRGLTTAEFIKNWVKNLVGLGGFTARPDPKDGAVVMATWAGLGWKAGDSAVSHDLYLGDNFEDVNAGAANTFRGNVTSTTFIVGLGLPGDPYPAGLVPGTTYYWRIDEVNSADPSSPWKGSVWNFSIPPRKAYQPVPGGGAKYQDPAAMLKWTAGLNAKLHYVYFGDNLGTVSNATGGAPMATTSYTPAGPLAKGKTYYWRIDEFDGAATHKGDVWSFSIMPDIAVTDPNLIGWWTFDEGAGAVLVDWSGHNNHGKIEGNPQWVDGYDGTALKFDGAGDLVNCGNLPSLTITGNITVMCWIKVAAFTKSWETILGKGDDSYRMSRGPQYGSAVHFGANGPSGGNLNALTTVTTNTWRHVAMVYDGANKIIYIDGVEDARVASAGAINTSTYALYIGANSQQANRNLTGVADDVRIYNKALMPADIQLLMRIDLKKAWNPKPVDGSTRDVETAMPLTWSRGDNAAQHAVYFGTNGNAVADANSSDTTGVYRGQQAGTSYTPAEGVQWGGGSYYWRVDEINNDATVTKGRIWSLKVADYLIVDDIESYNDIDPPNPGSNRVFDKWIDGFGTTTNGAVAGNNLPPYTERGNVHGGSQAMPLSYDNNLKFSEATLTLKTGNNWTRQGVANLSLWYRGAATNAAEKMYVALNGTAVVYHTDPNVAKTTAWTEWVIPLQQFSALGVNLSNVTSITIGFGTRGSTALPGGTGQMYLDDIRLYRSTIVP